eukprot:Gregarina_sp_Poly_1__5450@NODE_287_length_10022_cov_246_780311_g248_i0_p3_GENE_NODE_287_length_10022_cov_246_780311_g248_i0NODE_287_length_10022_cov_246_780311_g248_i0_p3_ORF_typecomplete_len495_score49_99PUB/PF09409_10/7_6e07_NODE_287_length_10022_cov_246_780311_g248_i048206304
MLVSLGEDIKDELLIPVNVYKCIGDLEKRTPIYRVQPALFASLVKRINSEPGRAGIVLDCRSREHVQMGYHKELAAALQAVSITERLPRHQVCTTQDRESFRDWLRVNTHLKDVFLFEGTSDASKFLNDGSFFTRVLKYMGQTSTKPKRVILLAGGLTAIAQNEVARALFSVSFSLIMVSTVKTYGVGSFVSVAESVSDMNLLRDVCLLLNARHIINVTNRRCLPVPTSRLPANDLGFKQPVSKPLIHELGLKYLPLKSEEKAMHFYKEIFRIVISASAEKSSFLVLDTSFKGFASVIIGIALVEVANLSVVNVLGMLRSRLDPPQFDSYTMAALSHLGDRSVESSIRIDRAVSCLATKFSPPAENETGKGNSPKKQTSEDLLKGSQPVSMHEKWRRIESYLEAHPHSHEGLQQIYSFVSGVFNKVLLNPNESKYKQLRMTNPKVHQVLGKSEVARMLMEAGGWVPEQQLNCWRHDDSRGVQNMRDVLVYMANV